MGAWGLTRGSPSGNVPAGRSTAGNRTFKWDFHGNDMRVLLSLYSWTVTCLPILRIF